MYLLVSLSKLLSPSETINSNNPKQKQAMDCDDKLNWGKRIGSFGTAETLGLENAEHIHRMAKIMWGCKSTFSESKIRD